MNKIVLQNNQNITLEKAFENFQRYNKAKSLSNASIEDYERCIKFFRQIL